MTQREQTTAQPSLGYVTSGRFQADIKFDEAMRNRQMAHRYFRAGMPFSGRTYMRRALRQWDLYRWYLERIQK